MDVDLSESESELIPEQCMQLHQNYPNPFYPSTTIIFNSVEEGTENIFVSIYNLKGQEVKQFQIDHITAGEHLVFWNGKDTYNNSVSSGIYFYSLNSGNEVHTKKMIRMK